MKRSESNQGAILINDNSGLDAYKRNRELLRKNSLLETRLNIVEKKLEKLEKLLKENK